MNRKARVAITTETLAILYAGTYKAPSDREISIGDALAWSVRDARVITPWEWHAIVKHANGLERGDRAVAIEVTGETTLAAARRLLDANGNADLLALNFTPAKNPGGGFLSGSQAQEESLARCRALSNAT